MDLLGNEALRALGGLTFKEAAVLLKRWEPVVDGSGRVHLARLANTATFVLHNRLVARLQALGYLVTYRTDQPEHDIYWDFVLTRSGRRLAARIDVAYALLIS